MPAKDNFPSIRSWESAVALNLSLSSSSCHACEPSRWQRRLGWAAGLETNPRKQRQARSPRSGPWLFQKHCKSPHQPNRDEPPSADTVSRDIWTDYIVIRFKTPTFFSLWCTHFHCVLSVKSNNLLLIKSSWKTAGGRWNFSSSSCTKFNLRPYYLCRKGAPTLPAIAILKLQERVNTPLATTVL